MKWEVDKIREQVDIPHKRAKSMRKFKLVAEQNIDTMEDALAKVEDSLAALEEAAKQAKFQDT